MNIKNHSSFEQGAVALPIVLVLAAILLTVGLAMNMSGNNKSDIATNKNRALNAFYIAESGIKDASERITRNKNYNNDQYTLLFEKGSAEIRLDYSVPDRIKITSEGAFENNIKTIEAIFDIDANGKITKSSWREL